jgi:beta-carotene ketolase (CrtW type)
MPRPATHLDPISPARQTLIGLSLASAIMGTWLGLHIWGVFFADLAALPIWLTFAAAAMLCWLSVGLFIVAHDAMHGSLAPFRPRLNWAMGQLALGLYAGFRFTPLNREHHLHHRHAGTSDDPDFDPRPPHGFWAWYLAFMRHYFGLREFIGLTIIVTAYQWVLGASLANVLVFWAVPALLSSLQLFAFGTYLPHHPDETGFTDRHRSRSNDLPVWASLLTCFHFGYHHEHHDQPGVPWWRLPAARARVRAAQAAV